MSTKVFVGNLAFRTTDQALQEAFGKHGEVKSGVIITRGRRSLGYGFVEYATAEQAAGSVDKMNKADIFGRQIKVELAKDPSERPAQGEGGAVGEGGEEGPAKRRPRRAPRSDYNEGSGAQNNAPKQSTHAPSINNNTSNVNNSNNNNEDGPKRRRNRNRRRKDGDYEGGDNSNTSSNTSVNNANNAPAKAPREPREPREQRPPREPREPREQRPPREPREPREKIPSKTTLFVANLPFSIDDAALLAAFTSTKAKAAHVVRTRTGRSRGYGFVEFETEADQQEALKTSNGKEISGANGSRNISVTISNSVSTPAVPAPATGGVPASS